MAHALLPAMLERGEGHIVLIASLAGHAPTPRASLYNATKFGLRGFGLGLREDLRATNVGASVISPGFIRDAGLFADAGASSSGLGTSSPEEVGTAVADAIERDRGEVTVAPWRQVRAARFAGALPRVGRTDLEQGRREVGRRTRPRPGRQAVARRCVSPGSKG